MSNKKFNILVVDDEPSIIRLYTRIFERNDYSVRGALGGKEAIELVKESIPDLILLDIMMPEMNGFEACRIIKEMKNRKQPFIFMFSNKVADTEEIRSAILEARADGFIPKTISKNLLIEQVEELLNSDDVSPL